MGHAMGLFSAGILIIAVIRPACNAIHPEGNSNKSVRLLSLGGNSPWPKNATAPSDTRIPSGRERVELLALGVAAYTQREIARNGFCLVGLGGTPGWQKMQRRKVKHIRNV